MTLVAERMPSLHTLERSAYGDDSNMQGILKSGPTKKLNKSVRTEFNSYIDKQEEHNQRNEDGKRLVRFCETEDSEKQHQSERDSIEEDTQEAIMFGNNLYFINSSDPNSAVRKLFPNSKLTPINPFISRPISKESRIMPSNSRTPNIFENKRNVFNKTNMKSNNEEPIKKDCSKKKIDRNVARRNFKKIPPETKPKPGRNIESTTPLIERIKQLTCAAEEINVGKNIEKRISSSLDKKQIGTESKKSIKMQEEIASNYFQAKDLPKQAKEGLNLMRYNQNILHARSQQSTEKRTSSPNKINVTEEARRSFLSSLSQENKGDPGDRTSVATNSTTADTVYSLSDIEEALTEEEKEIKEAFSQENKQDELELFVQQDAGRTERLRKRYSSTPKLEKPVPVMFSNNNFAPTNPNINVPQFTNESFNNKKDKPKFGSTIEILQQLQQQIETPYQMEGRRTACSNYSDSSIPISERLFYDESSDGYEPVHTKLNVHRTCSLDSKNYEEIDNYPSAFSVPRAISHEHPRLTHIDSDPYFYVANSVKYPGTLSGTNQSLEHNVYASSPDLHSYIPNRVSSYNNHPVNTRQLHPILQKQYCRYPVNDVPHRPADEGKILTPPIRMHTYMNIPTNAPCYPSPPPYSKVNRYTTSLTPPDLRHYETPYAYSNIYQNVPFQLNPHLMTIRRLCTERERGVPEGASSSHDAKEVYPVTPKDFYFPANIVTIPKPSSLPHHYCVDV